MNKQAKSEQQNKKADDQSRATGAAAAAAAAAAATAATEQSEPAAAASTGNNTDRPVYFPSNLYDMLQYTETYGYQHIVSWHSDGRAFRVHKHDEFVKLLPHFFRQTRYKSFRRQLNLYGFQRIWNGPEKGHYKHKYFIRGDTESLEKVLPLSRQQKKGQPESSSGEEDEDHSPSPKKKLKREASNYEDEATPKPVPVDSLPKLDFLPHQHQFAILQQTSSSMEKCDGKYASLSSTTTSTTTAASIATNEAAPSINCGLMLAAEGAPSSGEISTSNAAFYGRPAATSLKRQNSNDSLLSLLDDLKQISDGIDEENEERNLDTKPSPGIILPPPIVLPSAVLGGTTEEMKFSFNDQVSEDIFSESDDEDNIFDI